MLCPTDLAAAARGRLQHAHAVLGVAEAGWLAIRWNDRHSGLQHRDAADEILVHRFQSRHAVLDRGQVWICLLCVELTDLCRTTLLHAMSSFEEFVRGRAPAKTLL